MGVTTIIVSRNHNCTATSCNCCYTNWDGSCNPRREAELDRYYESERRFAVAMRNLDEAAAKAAKQRHDWWAVFDAPSRPPRAPRAATATANTAPISRLTQRVSNTVRHQQKRRAFVQGLRA